MAEKRLILKSRHIFCSSENLVNKMLERGSHRDKCTVVFNAFEAQKSEEVHQINRSNIRYDLFRIGYIGTISSWFDFSVILEVVNKLPNVIFYIV
jgi:teichuronic acid biosynthesis glycosyltransferase TuaH